MTTQYEDTKTLERPSQVDPYGKSVQPQSHYPLTPQEIRALQHRAQVQADLQEPITYPEDHPLSNPDDENLPPVKPLTTSEQLQPVGDSALPDPKVIPPEDDADYPEDSYSDAESSYPHDRYAEDDEKFPVEHKKRFVPAKPKAKHQPAKKKSSSSSKSSYRYR